MLWEQDNLPNNAGICRSVQAQLGFKIKSELVIAFETSRTFSKLPVSHSGLSMPTKGLQSSTKRASTMKASYRQEIFRICTKSDIKKFSWLLGQIAPPSKNSAHE